MAQLGERRGIKHGMKSAALAWRGMLEGTINPAKGESMTDQETPERAHVTADDIEAANDLIDFIEACPSMFHTAATIMAELDEAGFTYLPENAAWDIEPGGRYYTQRNTSSVIAFKVGEDLAATWGEDGVAGDYHFQLTASHSDSPTFKVKAVPELDGAGETLRLNTEAYGGMIDYTWFDRPLALAGRVLVREGDRIESRLLATEREVAIIPSLAIHMNRGVNEGFAPNRAVDLCPLISAGELKQGDFDALIAEELDVEPEQILGRDLFLVNHQDARIWGWADEFISTPSLTTWPAPTPRCRHFWVPRTRTTFRSSAALITRRLAPRPSRAPCRRSWLMRCAASTDRWALTTSRTIAHLPPRCL